MLPLVAGVLVGGKSSRYGRPKALEQLADGKTVIEHVVETAHRVADPVVLLGAGFEIPTSLRGHVQLPDFPKGAGPITGLYSLLTHAKDRWALMLACDLPLLREDLFRPLFEAVLDRPHCDAVAYGTDLPRRPAYTCCTLYHPGILSEVEWAIDHGEFRLQSLLADNRTQMIRPSPDEQRMLQDMNTPEDKTRLIGD